MKITHVEVLIRAGKTDTILLTFDAPNGCWPFTGQAYATMEAAHGTGVDYTRNHFGVEPEVVDQRPAMIKDVKGSHTFLQVE